MSDDTWLDDERTGTLYQVIGVLAHMAGIPSDDPHVIRALDLAAYGKTEDGKDVLPFEPTGRQPTGHVEIAHDGFAGEIIGHYTTREGKRGVVVQQDGTRVVHVYGEKWLNRKDD